jgi:hypothetical protein
VRWDGEYGNAERAESAVNALGTKNILSFRDSDGEDIGAWVTDRPTEFLNIKVPAEPVSSAPDDPDALLTDIEPQDKSQPRAGRIRARLVDSAATSATWFRIVDTQNPTRTEFTESQSQA